MLKKSIRSNPALEAVKHQLDTRFFRELTAEFAKISGLTKPTVKDVENLAIADVIFKHTGMSIQFKCEPYHGFNGYVILPQLNRNHALIRDWVKEYSSNDDAFRNLNELKTKSLVGFVNRNTGKVSGIFSKVKSIIAINQGCFYTYNGIDQTPEENAATILHEVGHVFGFFELLANTVTTNQALRAVKETFLNNNDPTLKISILKELEVTLDINIEDKEKIVGIKHTEDSLHTVLLKNTVEKQRSELGSSFYDRRGFEYLADQYAVRLGAGLAMITGMDKTYKLYGTKVRQSSIEFLFAQMKNIFFFTFVSIFSGGLYPLILLLLGDPAHTAETDAYDRPAERAARLRREMVDSLKVALLSKETKLRIIQEIETVKSIEEKMVDRWDIGVIAYGLIFPSARKARNKIKEQQLLEELATNSLYVNAAKLSTLV